MSIKQKLGAIQQELKVPKSQFNEYGGFAYRSCEDILNALKPLLKKHKITIIISDEMVVIGERYYIKATVSLSDDEGEITVSAFARESESMNKMNEQQITGSTSSYARKYALNGMFAIDDVKDADTTNTYEKEPKSEKLVKEPKPKRLATKKQVKIIAEVVDSKVIEAIFNHYKVKSLEELTIEQASQVIEKKVYNG